MIYLIRIFLIIVPPIQENSFYYLEIIFVNDDDICMYVCISMCVCVCRESNKGSLTLIK